MRHGDRRQHALDEHVGFNSLLEMREDRYGVVVDQVS